MAQVRADGALVGVPSAEFEPLAAGVAFTPDRIDGSDTGKARELLGADGAVISTGWPVEPASTVRAAAALLGTRLRWLESVQDRAASAETSTAGGRTGLHMHTDGGHVVVDVHGRDVVLRDHDVDYALVLCDTPARTGGASVVADGYRLVQRIRDGAPELYEFLTTVDLDVTSGYQPHGTPRVCRMIEWTRGGRLVLRATAFARPLPRILLHRDDHEHMLGAYADVLATVAAHAPRTPLTPGEILVLDNYRCPHGVEAHEGERRTHVLRCRTADAL